MLGDITSWVHYSGGGGISVSNNTVVNFPVHFLLLAGIKGHNIEIGPGLMPELYFNKNGNDQSLLLFYSIGYRYQKPSGKIRFNFTFSPMYDTSIKWQNTAVGIGFGYVF